MALNIKGVERIARAARSLVVDVDRQYNDFNRVNGYIIMVDQRQPAEARATAIAAVHAALDAAGFIVHDEKYGVRALKA